MECRECRERMDLYMAGALAGRWIEQFEQHLADCPRCARWLEQKQQLLTMLHGLPAPAPPEHLSSRIKAAAEAQLRHPEPQVRPAYYLKVAAACAVVVLTVGIGVVWRAPSARQAAAPSFSSDEVTVAAERSPRGAETPTMSAALRATSKPAELVEPTTVVASLAHAPRSSSERPQRQAASAESIAPDASRIEESMTVGSAAPKGHVEPELRLARAPSAGMVRTAEVRSAQTPTSLVRAAARVDSGGQLSLPEPEPTRVVERDLAARTLVGTVVANAVVSQYVREAVIESDKTIMALMTSAPSSMIEVTAKETETQVD